MDRSFGITMWEIFSFGEKPYNGMKHNDLKAFLKREERIGVSAILIETSCSAVVHIANMRMLHIWQFTSKVPAPYLKEPNAKENVKKVYDEIMSK